MFNEFTALDELNNQQRSAILDSLESSSLVLAGAGSGKTKVLITRIEYLLKVLKVKPSCIMAITFTNKAAKELLDRASTVTSAVDEMTVGTYHSICLKLLIEFGDEIGLDKFSLIDGYTKKAMAIKILTDMGLIVTKQVVSKFLSKVSSLKNKLITPKQYKALKLNRYNGREEALQNSSEYDFIEFYIKYQEESYKNRTIDFDDIILYTVALLESSDTVKEYIKECYKYILVDECQDSNIANIKIVNEFSKYANLFMVGDIDQSIYGFRNARPDYFIKLLNENRLELFKLEQNYRSTQTIVNASNEVIAYNKNRIPKTCFSQNEIGDKISYFNFSDSKREAKFIIDEIKNVYFELGYKGSDIMILYRTNSQSVEFEKAFINAGVQYILIGMTSFNDRAEVKDCLSFLRVYINRKDKQSFSRALKTLKGIGKEKINNTLLNLLDEEGDALKALYKYASSITNETVLESINLFIDVLELTDNKPSSVLYRVCENLIDIYSRKNDEKSLNKIENIKELLKVANDKEDTGMTVKDFIYQMDLLSKTDVKNTDDAVQMITVHSSKGLEAKVVFVVGMNEDIFPHINSLGSTKQIEEERRCMYVAMTRAKEKLYLTSFESNDTKKYTRSRFVDEIPNEYIEIFS